ncbi:hypothetical protein, conserved [Leishmania tarentolae]|uniref:Uncharacterized protein n=1 Tax=Leishmania tarentolae TaxID=5689 RepID=A0A640K8F4_LEITA|nr:hypothetical protein, conserved [Leishmania tarentolae]
MMLSSSSSSSGGWWPPLSRPTSLPQHQQQGAMQGNAHYRLLLQQPREGLPHSQVGAHDTVAAPSAIAALLSKRQQREREHQLHQRVPPDATSAPVASRDCGGIDDSSSAPSAASVPTSWSTESSNWRHHADNSGRPSGGTYQPTTISSTMTDRCPFSPKHATVVESRDDETCLADLRRQVAAQVEKRGPRRSPASDALGASAAAVSPLLPTSSSGGCRTSCVRRCDTPDDDALGVSADAHRRRRPASHGRPASRPRMAGVDAQRGADTECKASVAQELTRCSDSSSETGTTPLQWRSQEDSDDLCSSCRHHYCDCGHSCLDWRGSQHSDNDFTLKLSCEGRSEGDFGGGEDSSLCSVCRVVARTHAVYQGGATAFCGQPEDLFSEAVRGHRLCAGVPPLLHFSAPRTSAATKGGSASDVTTMTQCERVDRRMTYMQSADALVSDADGEHRGTHDGAAAATRELDRCTGSTQTDAAVAAATTTSLSEEQRLRHAEQEAAELKGIAAAHCAEVTLPLLQSELASFEARAALQQQVRFDEVESQLRVYLDEFRQGIQELSDIQMQQRAVQQEVAEAAQRAAAHVDRATSPIDTTCTSEAVDSAMQAAPSPVPPQRTVGTQYSDGTLERLTVVQAEAESWMVQLLFSIEAERRDALTQDEAECRDWLLHAVEEPCRRRLLRCRAELLHWQHECATVRHRASFAFDLRELALHERLARQELTEEVSVAQHEIIEDFERQLRQTAAAAAHAQMKALENELAKVQSKLSVVEAEHADTLEHAKQLRLQLIYALRMPTVTLVDRSTISAEARGDAAAAATYPYANMTTETWRSHTLGMRGDTHNGCADSAPSVPVASATGSGTGVAARPTISSGVHEGLEDLPVHRRFARAHQEALRVTRAQCRTV